MPLLSLIVPCYNEEESLGLLYSALSSICSQLLEEYELASEILLVNDGSKDGTLGAMKALAAADTRVHYISFSRNFGKEAAMYAGLIESRGDYVVVMDADMQHPPSLLKEMYQALVDEGYDCAAAMRSNRRGEPWLKRLFSHLYYPLINRMSPTKLVPGATDYGMMTRQMVEAILSLPEHNRFTKGINSWVGFEVKWLPYENLDRVAGSTKWSLWGLLLYSLQGLISFSTAPLAFASVAGLVLCLIALISVVWVVVRTIIYGDPVAGFPTLITVIIFIGGIQMLFLGIIGQYLAKTYLESKGRPIYIVKERSPIATPHDHQLPS